MNSVGRFLIILGGFIVIIGIVISIHGRIPLLGRLPGDIFFQKGSFRVYLPIMTGVILSIVLTILVNLLSRR
jgi:hypothetical protein